MLRKMCLLAVGLGLPAYGAGPAEGATSFKVRIENVSTANTLKTSDGKTAPAPNSPGVWLVHTGKSPLFMSGQAEMRRGLEAQAEDGNPMSLAKWLEGRPGKKILASGAFNTPVGDAQPGPLLPGKAYEFTITAAPGVRLSLATMFAQSNDLFYAPGEEGIALFDTGGSPIQGEITQQFLLWDAGTEVNQEPGLGKDQAPRQAGPNTGADEGGVVRLVQDGFRYPPVTSVLRVTIMPEP